MDVMEYEYGDSTARPRRSRARTAVLQVQILFESGLGKATYILEVLASQGRAWALESDKPGASTSAV